MKTKTMLDWMGKKKIKKSESAHQRWAKPGLGVRFLLIC